MTLHSTDISEKTSSEHFSYKAILGVDPGRDKCGIAVMSNDHTLLQHEVVSVDDAIASIQTILNSFNITFIVLGDQTTSLQWKAKLETELKSSPTIYFVDERNTTLEARDRYWKLYPASGLQSLIPQSIRQIPRPIDDIVAILLIERYLSGSASRFSNKSSRAI